MDGRTLSPLSALLVLAAGLTLGACAGWEPEPDSMPVAMYDSPVVANGIPDDSSADGEETPAERQKSDEEPRTAEADDQADDRVASPSDARQGTPAAAPPDSGDSTAESDPETSSAPALATQQGSNDTDDGPEPQPTREHSETAPATHTPRRESDSETATDPAPSRTEPSEDERRAERTSSTDRDEEPGREGADRPTTSRSDAARYAAAIYELNGVPFPENARTDIAEMYRHCREDDAVFQSRAPKAGDLVFFHNVTDANDDDRNNDWYTWVGLVERVESSGTVHLLGYRDGAVRSLTMNLNRPDVHSDGDEVLNARLRDKHGDDPPFTQYLAGQLFAGYCSLLGDRSELLVVDNWQPGMELAPSNR